MPDSSPDQIAPDQTQVDTGNSDANPAASSSAENEGATSLFDSVKAALDGGQEERSPGSERDQTDSSQSQKTEEQAQAGSEEDLGEITEDEIKKYAPRTQKRVRQLLDQRQELNTKLTDLEPKAQGFDRLSDFMGRNQLSVEDLNLGLQFVALRKSDPFKAWELIAPIAQELAQSTGTVLPSDLQEQVNLGYLSKEHAQELVRARAREKVSTTQAENLTRQQREDAEQAAAEKARGEAEAIVNQASSTADEWETAKKRGDPEWSLKQDRIAALVENKVLKGEFPKTKQEVVKMLDDIHKQVTEEITRIAPKPRTIRPSTVGAASSGAIAEPSSAFEAAKMRLGGSA